ncbi:class I SAM-dependent methyltransferase [Patescibacteria group bacterium]
MSSDEAKVREFYESVSEKGWDFPDAPHTSNGKLWSFYEGVVKHRIAESADYHADILLDIGTGGGEKILAIAHHFHLVVGIDNSPGMIVTANKKRAKKPTRNTRFLKMEADAIRFPDEFFDVITCRHSHFRATEVFRLLRKGEYFFTQQVGEGDKFNIKQFFGRGQQFGERDGMAVTRQVQELNRAGFSSVELQDYDAVEFYQDHDSLRSLLTHAPILMDFGGPEDEAKLAEFVRQNTTTQGIKTNSRRYLIIARK